MVTRPSLVSNSYPPAGVLIIANCAVTKTLILFNAVIDSLGLRFLPACDKYMHLFLDNANTGYAEVITSQ